MKYSEIVIFLVITILLAACGNNTPSDVQNILDLQKDENKQSELLDAYQGFVSSNPSDAKWTPEFLLKGAELAFEENQVQDGLSLIDQLIRNFPGTGQGKAGLELLAKSYVEKFKLPAVAVALYKKIQADDPTHAAASAYLGANGDLKLDDYLTSLKGNFMDTTSGNINRTAIRNYLRGVTVRDYAVEDDASASWLLSAGQTARMVKNNEAAVKFFDLVLDKYPSAKEASQSLFLKAFTLDNEMNQDEASRPLYEKFITTYPEDEFADDAQFLLDNLGKTDEEIIQSFQKTAK